jgi:hypothetical protein
VVRLAQLRLDVVAPHSGKAESTVVGLHGSVGALAPRGTARHMARCGFPASLRASCSCRFWPRVPDSAAHQRTSCLCLSQVVPIVVPVVGTRGPGGHLLRPADPTEPATTAPLLTPVKAARSPGTPWQQRRMISTIRDERRSSGRKSP